MKPVLQIVVQFRISANNERGDKKVKKRFICVFISLTLCGLLGLASIGLTAEEPWVRKADMPTARIDLSTSVVNGIIYAIGGEGTRITTAGVEVTDNLSTVEAYDPTTDMWTTKADMPTRRQELSTSAVNGIIYAIGGWFSSNRSTVEAYDPVTDTWTKKADMPTARSGLSTGVVNGIVYAIGGWVSSSTFTSAVEAYDPATNTWTKKADMPTPRGYFSISAVNGIIYAIGGWDGSFRGEVEAYDPMTDTWTKKADMPRQNLGMSSCALNGLIYVIGGWGPVATVNVYDPLTNTWTSRPDMTTRRAWTSSSMVNGKIYTIGGGTEGTNSATPVNVVEEYNWLLAPERVPQSVNAQGKLAVQWGKLKNSN